MEINQFAEFVSAVVRQLPRNLDSATAQRWILEQGSLADALRKALASASVLELYIFGKQKTGGYEIGFDLEKHLEETKLINRAFSLDDELVKGWIADPSTYPEEFKGKAIFLWKSKRASGDNRRVAYLAWGGEHVVVDWYWLGRRWDGSNPALLASS